MVHKFDKKVEDAIEKVEEKIAFDIPLPLRAEISTTSQPKLSFKSLMLILSPDFSIISIMLTAITTGIPNSISCVDK